MLKNNDNNNYYFYEADMKKLRQVLNDMQKCMSDAMRLSSDNQEFLQASKILLDTLMVDNKNPGFDPALLMANKTVTQIYVNRWNNYLTQCNFIDLSKQLEVVQSNIAHIVASSKNRIAYKNTADLEEELEIIGLAQRTRPHKMSPITLFIIFISLYAGYNIIAYFSMPSNRDNTFISGDVINKPIMNLQNDSKYFFRVSKNNPLVVLPHIELVMIFGKGNLGIVCDIKLGFKHANCISAINDVIADAKKPGTYMNLVKNSSKWREEHFRDPNVYSKIWAFFKSNEKSMSYTFMISYGMTSSQASYFLGKF